MIHSSDMITRPLCSSLIAFAVGVGGLLAAPSRTLAQGTIPNSVAPSRDGQKPFALDVIGAILYDSNVARGADVVNAFRKLHKSDVTYTPGLAARSFIPLGQNSVFLNAEVGYEFREYNKELESGRADIAGGAVAKLGPCQVGANGGYAVRQSDIATLPLRVTRNRVTIRSAGGQVFCASSGGLTGLASASVTDTGNSADVNLVDSNTVSINTGFGYGNKQFGTLQLIASYTKTVYDASASPLVVSQPGFETYGGGLQYSRDFGNRLQGSATIGFQTVRSDSAVLGDVSNLTGSGSFSYRLNSRASLIFNYERGAAPSVFEGYDYILEQSFGAEAKYNLSSRLNASIGAKSSKTEYKGLSPIAIDIPADSDVRILFAQVGFTLGRTASVALKASQEKRDSTSPIFDYISYQVGVTAKKSF